MPNRQVYPSSLFPLRGDVSAEFGATTVTVQGILGFPIQDAYLPPAEFSTILFDSTNNDFFFGVPWDIPVGQVLEFEGYGYSPAGISWLAADTLAVGDGTQGDVSGAMAMTALILFGSPAYDYYYEAAYTTIFSGAVFPWNLVLPPTPGSTGQVLTTDGHGVTSWTTVGGGGSGFTYTVTSKTANYTAVSGDDVWTNGTFTVTLPVLSTVQRVKVNNRGTGTITIVPTSGLINGASSVIIARQFDSFEFSGDGTNVGIE